MSLRRIVTTLASVVVALGLTFTLTPGAASAQAKATHSGWASAGEVGDSGVFYARGRITTAYVNQPVVLQRQPRAGGTWRFVKTTRINSEHRFYMRFNGNSGTCFRVYLRETPRYRAWGRRIGCIVAG